MSEPPRTPGPTLRVVGGPLLAYHVLIFVGAYFVVAGILEGSLGSELIGGTIVAAGIAVEVGVLVWSARLVRRAAIAESVRRSRGDAPPGATAPPPRRCLHCNWEGATASTVCPQCGAYTVLRSGT